MRASIMLLSGSGRDEINARYAERLLTDISAAFGHVFSLRQEVIGEKSQKAHGEPLTDGAIDACQQCQAVFSCDGSAEGMQELYDALDLPLLIRSYCVPEVLCGRHEAPVSLYVGTVLSLDEDTLRRAAHAAFRFAQEEDIRLCHAAPTGASKAAWDAALRVQEAQFPQGAAAALTAPEAIRALITGPERMGLLLCPPYAGGIMAAAGQALCAHPSVIHEMCPDEALGVYAASVSPDDGETGPYSAALAVAKLLRFSLKLPKEAACLEAAVNNVMAAGWHVKREDESEDGGIDGLGVAELICEQVSLAGELMGKALPDAAREAPAEA